MALEVQGLSLGAWLARVLRRVGLYALLIFIGTSMVIPLVIMVSTSLQDARGVFQYPPKFIPWPPVWENYREIWVVIPYFRFFINSVIVAVLMTAGHVFTSAMAAFAFARLRFPFRDQLFFGYLATMMIPGTVTIIPNFILMKWFGWLNTYQGLIIPAMFVAFGTFLLRQFFLTIPQDLVDAARIDGATPYRIFWSIILPAARPALAALTMATFMGNWQSFMWPLLITDSVELKTLPIGLAYFQEVYQHASPNWPLLMAAAFVAMLPIVLLFIFNQRYFIQGVRLSGVQR